MTTARNIITLALESMNKLSPGEILDADIAAACLRRLNSITDGWNTGRDMMPQDQIVSGSVTGTTITLGSGDFSSINLGDEIIQLQSDGYPMEPITMQQYNNIYLKTQQGRPQVWVWDGSSTIYVYPAASGNTVNIMTRVTLSTFSDLDTVYTLPSGYEGAFSATLAVAMAPALIGKVTQDLKDAEKKAMFNIQNNTIRPAINSANPMARRNFGGTILQGWR